MNDAKVLRAYAARAAAYTTLFGSLDDLHELDRQCIQRWAEQVTGRVIDAGCGPGQWTDFLHGQGVDITGIDLVPDFINSARIRFPGVPFQLSSLRSLDIADGELGAVLAWYSLIHIPPAELPHVLRELARVLSASGRLLIAFFAGESMEPFDHAVTTAYYWSVPQLTSLLQDAGFDVLDVETRHDPDSRPHAAISATVRF